MEVTTNLAPFWHAVEQTGDETNEPVRLKLKPLTQPQIAELYETFESDGERTMPTARTWYRAGVMGLNGAGEIENLTINGKPARWPRDRDAIPFDIVMSAGVRLCSEAWGADAGETEKN